MPIKVNIERKKGGDGEKIFTILAYTLFEKCLADFCAVKVLKQKYRHLIFVAQRSKVTCVLTRI